MSYAEVQRNIRRNTVSNYLRTVLGMGVGLLTFRLLYQGLTREEFGFWSLLWSVFGYGILLDFGFGFAVQKRVAELSVKGQWNELSQTLSTILFAYAGVAFTVGVTVLLGAEGIVRLLDVSAANAERFRVVLILFFAGLGLAFPMGMFPEILRGQQRQHLANNLISAALVVRLVLLWMAVQWGWGFTAIVAIALACALVPDLLAAPFALRTLPGVRISPRLCSLRMVRETMQFSMFAYISTATNLVLGKTDQLVLGVGLSIGAVGLYQAGAKVAEIFSQFTRQIQDTLSPAAAHLHARGDRDALRDLLLQSTRWSVIVATPLYLLCAFHMSELLRILTGDADVAPEVWRVGQVLLAWYYTTLLTHSVSKRIFMMTGHERPLMWLGMGEALANLVLSIVLVMTFRSVEGVAVGSLLPTLAFGWLRLWPWVAREVGMDPRALFQKTVLPAWRGSLPLLLVLGCLGALPEFRPANPWLTVLTHGPAAALAGCAGLWMWTLTEAERAAFRQRLNRARASIVRHLAGARGSAA